MAIPTFLDAPFRTLAISITDVADIITSLRSELTAFADPWTEPVSGTFKSPARADGAFFTITVTRISQTRIAYVVKDHLGMQVNNDVDTRQDIRSGGNTDVFIHTSPLYVIVDSGGATYETPECFVAGVLCREPEPLAKPRPVYFASYGPRHNSDGAYANLTHNAFNYNWYLHEGATSYAADINFHLDLRAVSSGYYKDRFSMCGTMMFLSLECIDSSWLLGRHFNMLLTDGQSPYQSEFAVPLDAETLGTFKIIGWGTLGGGTSHQDQRVAVRVA